MAWYLDPSPRDFTKAALHEFQAARPLPHFDSSEGVAGTSMPPWGKVLQAEQIASSRSTYVLQTFTKEPRRTLKPRNLPDTNPVAMSAGIGRRAGKQIFLQRCTGCHGRKADGKGPNSLDILPHPRNLRNTGSSQSVPDRRLFESILYGVQGTAMPSWIDYGLSTARRRQHHQFHSQSESRQLLQDSRVATEGEDNARR